MKFELGDIRNQDEKKAIEFAIIGMHFNWFIKNRLWLKIYGRYFWYLETLKASQIIAEYADGKFVGVIVADIKGEPKLKNTFGRRLYIKVVELFRRFAGMEGASVYGAINKRLLRKYCEKNDPDGEILFFAADPYCGIKGVGTRLLRELERRENGKKLFLYTDSSCTYQFYDRRGFERVCSEETILEFGGEKIPLSCFLYSKVLGSDR